MFSLHFFSLNLWFELLSALNGILTFWELEPQETQAFTANYYRLKQQLSYLPECFVCPKICTYTAKETSSRLCQMKMRHVRPVKNTNSLSTWHSFHNNMWVLTLCCYSSREIEQECDISLQNSDGAPIERYNLVEQQEHSAIVIMQPILRFDKWL